MPDLTEAEIRKIAEQVVQQLGTHATPDNVERVVHETIQRIEQNESPKTVSPATTRHNGNSATSDRVIVTAFGKNKIGILGGITSTLASNNCDVIDLSQKILKEFFTIMLLIDISNSNLDFESIKQELINTAENLISKLLLSMKKFLKPCTGYSDAN